MQVMPFNGYRNEDLLDPKQNIKAGLRVLMNCLVESNQD